MSKPIVLHLGDPVKWNQEVYEKEFCPRFHIVRNKDLDRESFVKALKEKKYVRHTVNNPLPMVDFLQVW